jgi:hypothetical protein
VSRKPPKFADSLQKPRVCFPRLRIIVFVPRLLVAILLVFACGISRRDVSAPERAEFFH